MSPDPFSNRFSLPGLAAVAQIEALQTSTSPDKRLAARLILARKLVSWGLDRKQLSVALRLVSWMMKLPKPESLQFREKFLEFDTMNTTYPLTDLEEILIEEHKEEWLNEGLEKGLQSGLKKGNLEARQRDILETLELRFERVPEGLREAVEEICDADHLARLFRKAVLCSDLEDFTSAL